MATTYRCWLRDDARRAQACRTDGDCGNVTAERVFDAHAPRARDDATATTVGELLARVHPDLALLAPSDAPLRRDGGGASAANVAQARAHVRAVAGRASAAAPRRARRDGAGGVRAAVPVRRGPRRLPGGGGDRRRGDGRGGVARRRARGVRGALCDDYAGACPHGVCRVSDDGRCVGAEGDARAVEVVELRGRGGM